MNPLFVYKYPIVNHSFIQFITAGIVLLVATHKVIESAEVGRQQHSSLANAPSNGRWPEADVTTGQGVHVEAASWLPSTSLAGGRRCDGQRQRPQLRQNLSAPKAPPLTSLLPFLVARLRLDSERIGQQTDASGPSSCFPCGAATLSQNNGYIVRKVEFEANRMEGTFDFHPKPQILN